MISFEQMIIPNPPINHMTTSPIICAADGAKSTKIPPVAYTIPYVNM